jgi:phage-related protein
MGFFENIEGFFTSSVPNFFTNTIPAAANSAYDKVAGVVNSGIDFVSNSIVSPVKETVTNVVNTLYNDSKAYVSGVKDVADTLIKEVGTLGANVVDTAGETVSNLGSSLSMPLVMGALAVGAFVLMK